MKVGYIEDVSVKKGYGRIGIGKQNISYVTNYDKTICENSKGLADFDMAPPIASKILFFFFLHMMYHYLKFWYQKKPCDNANMTNHSVTGLIIFPSICPPFI
jgi:hypothetical protein